MQVVVFSVAGVKYALPVAAVREVLPYQKPHVLPGADPWDLGIVSMRGSIVHVWDLRTRLGLTPGGAPGGFIVVEGKTPIALVVERILGVQDVPDELQTFGYLPYALGIVPSDGNELLVVLNAGRLVGAAPPAEDELETLSKRELAQRAREAGIEGRSRLDRDGLIAALRAARRS